MDLTRRRLLGGTAGLASLTGCLGGDDATPTSTAAATAEPTTSRATETERPTPSETPTEDPTATPEGASIRLWPTSVTTVFEGDVSSDAIDAAFEGSPSPSRTYSGEQGGEPVTYFVVSTASFYVATAREAFEDADGLSVNRIYRGVGPNYRRQYGTVIGEQVAERADVDAGSVSLSPGRKGDHQFLDFTAPVDQSALVPLFPEVAFQRANGGSEERIVEPGGFVLDTRFMIRQSRSQSGVIVVDFTLDEDGMESLADAVETASDEEPRASSSARSSTTRRSERSVSRSRSRPTSRTATGTGR